MLSIATRNPSLFFRFILFLAFLGHGLVNLELSPSIALHINLLKAVLPSPIDPLAACHVLAGLDISLALLILFKWSPKYTLSLAGLYLAGIAIAGWSLYFELENSIFGFAEIMRRLPWILFIIFLYFQAVNNETKYHLLRIGLAFSFLAHGTASLGLLGINEGHIELATQIIPEENVRDFVFYSGISDTIIGLFIITGLFSLWATRIAILWLVFVVYLSFSYAFPDGIFRLGFLLAAFYVAIDVRCHSKNILKAFTRTSC